MTTAATIAALAAKHRGGESRSEAIDLPRRSANGAAHARRAVALRNGKTTLFACPFTGSQDEIMFREGIPAKLRRERWRRWCFFSEAWMAPIGPGELPKQRPDRMEVIVFAAEDGATGAKLMATRQILRLPGLPAKLLPLVLDKGVPAFCDGSAMRNEEDEQAPS